MDNRKYWQNRFLELKAKGLDNVKEYEQALFKRMNGLQGQIDKELQYWYNRYAGNNNIPNDEAEKMLNNINSKNFENTLEQFKQKAIEGGYEQELNNDYFKSQVARLSQLENQLKEYGSRFAGDESDKMKNTLASQYQDSYMKNNYTIQQQKGQFNSDFAKFDDNQLRTAVSKPWKNSDFSSRIWKQYRDELPSQIMDSIARGTITGRSYANVERDFKERFQEVKSKNIHRLVITEMGHTTENATAKSYEENDVKKYEYLATLEARTCPVCRHLDGKVFTFSTRSEGVNYPILHPYCRCTTVPYVPKKQQAGVRYDDKNKQNIQNMNYNQWLNHINAGTLDKYKVEPNNPVIKPTLNTTPPKNPSDPFDKYRPKPDNSIDFNKASTPEIRNYITNNFGMNIDEGNTPTLQFNDYALRSVAKTLGSFKELYNALPEKIPSLEAGNGRMRNVIACYAFTIDKNTPAYLKMNSKFFRGGQRSMQNMVEHNVSSGWFAKNSNDNHVVMHEFSHHLDKQLSKMMNENDLFSNSIFRKLRENNDFNVKDLSRYGATYYNKRYNSKDPYTELFAEMFTEAYGNTPRPIALKFKQIFEEQAKEVLKNDRTT